MSETLNLTPATKNLEKNHTNEDVDALERSLRVNPELPDIESNVESRRAMGGLALEGIIESPESSGESDTDNIEQLAKNAGSDGLPQIAKESDSSSYAIENDNGGFYENNPKPIGEALGLENSEKEDENETAVESKKEALKNEREQKEEQLRQAQEEYDRVTDLIYNTNFSMSVFEDAKINNPEMKARLESSLTNLSVLRDRRGEEMAKLRARIDEIDLMLKPSLI